MAQLPFVIRCFAMGFFTRFWVRHGTVLKATKRTGPVAGWLLLAIAFPVLILAELLPRAARAIGAPIWRRFSAPMDALYESHGATWRTTGPADAQRVVWDVYSQLRSAGPNHVEISPFGKFFAPWHSAELAEFIAVNEEALQRWEELEKISDSMLNLLMLGPLSPTPEPVSDALWPWLLRRATALQHLGRSNDALALLNSAEEFAPLPRECADLRARLKEAAPHSLH